MTLHGMYRVAKGTVDVQKIERQKSNIYNTATISDVTDDHHIGAMEPALAQVEPRFDSSYIASYKDRKAKLRELQIQAAEAKEQAAISADGGKGKNKDKGEAEDESEGEGEGASLSASVSAVSMPMPVAPSISFVRAQAKQAKQAIAKREVACLDVARLAYDYDHALPKQPGLANKIVEDSESESEEEFEGKGIGKGKSKGKENGGDNDGDREEEEDKEEDKEKDKVGDKTIAPMGWGSKGTLVTFRADAGDSSDSDDEETRRQVEEDINEDKFRFLNNSFRVQPYSFFGQLSEAYVLIFIELWAISPFHGYHISYQVVHWRANPSLLLSYPTISLA